MTPHDVIHWRGDAKPDWQSPFVPVRDLVREVRSRQSAMEREDAACAAFSRAITHRQVLLDLLGRPGADRVAVARARARACDADHLLSDAMLNALIARRTLIGLLRQSRRSAEVTVHDITRRLPVADGLTRLAEISRALVRAGIGKPELFGDGEPHGTVAAMIDRLRGADLAPTPVLCRSISANSWSVVWASAATTRPWQWIG